MLMVTLLLYLPYFDVVLRYERHTQFMTLQWAFAVAPVRGASLQQRQAVELGAVVLSEEDHEASLQELKRR